MQTARVWHRVCAGATWGLARTQTQVSPSGFLIPARLSNIHSHWLLICFILLTSPSGLSTLPMYQTLASGSASRGAQAATFGLCPADKENHNVSKRTTIIAREHSQEQKVMKGHQLLSTILGLGGWAAAQRTIQSELD